MRTLISIALIATVACKSDDSNDDSAKPTALTVSLEHVGLAYAFVDAGSLPSIAPGTSHTFEVDAGIGQRLSFGLGLDQSNDWFVGAGSEGIPLWNADRSPVEGELNGALHLWDAGTEADGLLGEGPDQGARQSSPDQGTPDEDTAVRVVEDHVVQDWLSVVSTHLGDTRFEITLTNTSDPYGTASGPVDLAWTAGSWVVHHDEAHGGLWPLYRNGIPAPTELEALAERGDDGPMTAWAAEQVGITVPLGGVFWVVTNEANPLFTDGQADPGQGLEGLCEDGAPADLAAYWEGADATAFGLSDAPDGVYEPAPVLPGERFVLDIESHPGDALHLAWMYAESNDICFALADTGLPLFDGDQPISGLQTGLRLIDVGTEVNQPPGLGDEQAPRQTDKNTGAAENGLVRTVDDPYDYGAASDLVQITIE